MTQDASPPGRWELFRGFFAVGILGFGGVLPLARRMSVDQKRWLSPAAFTDLLALCQFLPGANIVNLAVSLGGRYHGPAGALAAVAGLLAAPIGVVIALGALYGRFADVPMVAHGVQGLAAAASGLVLATALRIAGPLRRKPRGIAVALLAFAAIALLRWPLLPVLAVLLPVSLLVHRRAA